MAIVRRYAHSLFYYVKHNEEQELTEAIRGCIKDRAIWFYLLYKEAQKLGTDADEMASKAIFKYRLGDLIEAVFHEFGVQPSIFIRLILMKFIRMPRQYGASCYFVVI